MAEEILLKLENIHKSYNPPSGAVPVLKGLNLRVNRGDTLAITGPSGSGKSTLLSLIGALDKADKGSIVFAGQNISSYTDQELVNFRMKKVGIVFQQHHLLPQCTALENILLPTLPLHTPAEQARERAMELLKEIHLSDRADHFPSQLSGGESQRIAVARALINDPDLLLADEPTGSLDRDSAQSLLDLLKQFTGTGKTLITVTHADFVASAMNIQHRLQNGIVAEED